MCTGDQYRTIDILYIYTVTHTRIIKKPPNKPMLTRDSWGWSSTCLNA